MSTRYLLDTNIVSALLKPEPEARLLVRMAAAKQNLVTASVVVHELWFGAQRLAHGRKRELIEQFIQATVLPTLPVLDYDTKAAFWHAAERARLQGQGLTPSFADGQIAAVCAVNDCVMVTVNQRDFELFEGITVENWL